MAVALYALGVSSPVQIANAGNNLGSASIPVSSLGFQYDGTNWTTLPLANKPMVVLALYTYPYPYFAPTSVTLGGLSMTAGPVVQPIGVSQPQRTLQFWLLPLTGSSAFTTTPVGATNYLKLIVTYPAGVNVGVFDIHGTLLVATGVDPTATLAFPNAQAQAVTGAGVAPTLLPFSSPLVGATGDMIVTVGSYSDYGNPSVGTDDPYVSSPAGYNLTHEVNNGSGSGSFQTAYKICSGATSDSVVWAVPPSYSSSAYFAIMGMTLKAASGGGGGGNPSFMAPISYIVQPGRLTFVQWASKMNVSLNAKGDALIVSDEKRWKEWASKVVTSQSVSFLSPPNPSPYNDWRAWARDLLLTLSLSGF